MNKSSDFDNLFQRMSIQALILECPTCDVLSLHYTEMFPPLAVVSLLSEWITQQLTYMRAALVVYIVLQVAESTCRQHSRQHSTWVEK